MKRFRLESMVGPHADANSLQAQYTPIASCTAMRFAPVSSNELEAVELVVLSRLFCDELQGRASTGLDESLGHQLTAPGTAPARWTCLQECSWNSVPLQEAMSAMSWEGGILPQT